VTAPAEIQDRACRAAGFFAFQSKLKPVPETPTHCRGRGCGTLLEPLRRYSGLCRVCVLKRMRRAARKRDKRELRVLRDFVRQGERHIEVECGCGAKYVMRLSTFNAQRPTRCRRCRLRDNTAATLGPRAREAQRVRRGDGR
jgi:hypothetical protein